MLSTDGTSESLTRSATWQRGWVLMVLLTNLRVQERQSHVCTSSTVAIAIVTRPHWHD